jgi:hypothetical protein
MVGAKEKTNKMNLEDMNYKDPIEVLEKKYPVVFKKLSPAAHSLPSGWVSRVDKLCADLTPIIEEHLKKYPSSPEEYPFTIEQIKEKFGGLRFYFQTLSEDDEFHKTIAKLVDRAEDDTYSICEVTGRPGMLCKKGGHYRTVCEEIQKNEDYKVLGNGNS